MSETKQGLRVDIRDVRTSDFPRYCEIRNLTLVQPTRPELMEERDRMRLEGEILIRLAATVYTDGGESIVAVGYCNHWESMAEGLYYVGVDVDPEWRRSGIGSALFDELMRRARAVDARKVIAVCREDIPAGHAFLEGQGFVFHQHLIDSELDFAAFEPGRFEPHIRRLADEGIEIRGYLELGDSEENRRRMHALYNDCDVDTPGIEDWGLSTFDGFEAGLFKGSSSWPEGYVVAVHGDEWVGLSLIFPVVDTTYGTDFSGVRRAWRGKGIGLAAKSVALGRAKAAGGVICRAQNDKRNQPMLAINAALGFQPKYGWIYMRKEL